MPQQIKMWIPVMLAIGWTIYLNDWSKEITYRLLIGDITGAYDIYQGKAVESAALIMDKHEEKDRLFTKDEIAKYNNINNGLYLSILGQVFDVTKGEQYYAPDSTYYGFIGRDASMAFITGDFTEHGLVDDVSSLTNSQAKSLENWLRIYHEKYIYKGKLVGRFYDATGQPTGDLKQFEEKVKNAQQEILTEAERKKMFPPCNIEWKPEEGSRVWCTKQSGGISREWIGVPRKYFDEPNGESRCACVKLDSTDYLENRGKFREYENCEKNAASCSKLTL